MTFHFIIPEFFESQMKKLSEEIFISCKKTLSLLSLNPRHPSLKTHKVLGCVGDFGGDIFEAYVTKKYRLTWEYGPNQGEITLRNVDNHDECLDNP